MTKASRSIPYVTSRRYNTAVFSVSHLLYCVTCWHVSPHSSGWRWRHIRDLRPDDVCTQSAVVEHSVRKQFWPHCWEVFCSHSDYDGWRHGLVCIRLHLEILQMKTATDPSQHLAFTPRSCQQRSFHTYSCVINIIIVPNIVLVSENISVFLDSAHGQVCRISVSAAGESRSYSCRRRISVVTGKNYITISIKTCIYDEMF